MHFVSTKLIEQQRKCAVFMLGENTLIFTLTYYYLLQQKNLPNLFR